MTEAEEKAIAHIRQSADPAGLRQLAANARGKSVDVEKAALRRLAEVCSNQTPGTVEHDCWTMIFAVEELRRLNGRKVCRMNRMRPKIDKEGEIAALEYCARNPTEGFAEVMDYGMPELTAEAIVLKHSEHFTEFALAAARARLEGAGVRCDERGHIAAAVGS
jgi:hypothetical protein